MAQRKMFLVTREELFAKATEKVDQKLTAFVENTKYMQVFIAVLTTVLTQY